MSSKTHAHEHEHTEQLTGAALNRAVHEALGHIPFEDDLAKWWTTPPLRGQRVTDANYTTDANALRELFAEVERRGRQFDFTMALLDELSSVQHLLFPPDVAWHRVYHAATATPEQHCRAFLRTVGADNG